jgi:hypothetical protein
MTDPIQNTAHVSSGDRPVGYRRRGGLLESSMRPVVILNLPADRSPSDRVPREGNGLGGSASRRPVAAVEYVPAHGIDGSAGTGRWSR